MTWVHWVVYNLPATAGGLSEGVAFEDLPAETGVGLNDWQPTKAQLETAIQGHVLARAELMGTYQKQR